MAAILNKIDDILYTWCLIYMLAGAGIYFTVKTRFVQIRMLKDCFHCMFEKKSSSADRTVPIRGGTCLLHRTGASCTMAGRYLFNFPDRDFCLWLQRAAGLQYCFHTGILYSESSKLPGSAGRRMHPVYGIIISFFCRLRKNRLALFRSCTGHVFIVHCDGTPDHCA